MPLKTHKPNHFNLQLDGTLRLGLIPSQTQIRKSALKLQINQNTQYKKRIQFSTRKKKRGGEEEIQDSHSTPYLVNIDSSFIFNSFRASFFYDLFTKIGQVRGREKGFFNFTTGIRNLRNPTCRAKNGIKFLRSDDIPVSYIFHFSTFCTCFLIPVFL